MSAPEIVTPPPAEAVAEPAPRAASRRASGAVMALAAALVVIIGAVAASPFWAPAVMPLLPWDATAKPQPAKPDPAIAALRGEIGKDEAAAQQLGQRLAALEAKQAPDLAPLQQRVAALEAKSAADLAPLQQQLAALGKTTTDLTQAVAALQKAEQAQPATDPRNTALALVLLQIREAVDIGRPFAAEYQTLTVMAGDRQELAAAAAPLAEPATAGVASRAALVERLRQLAPQIAGAAPPPADDWGSRIAARLRGLVTIRRVDGAGQSPAEAAVATAEHDLAGGDLAGSVAALGTLTGPAQVAAQPWLQTAKARLTVEGALRQLQTVLVAMLGNTVPAPGKS